MIRSSPLPLPSCPTSTTPTLPTLHGEDTPHECTPVLCRDDPLPLLAPRCKDGAALVVSSSDGYCSFVMFEPGELGEPHIPDTGSHQQATEEVCTEKEMLPDCAPPTQLAQGAGSLPPTVGLGGNKTTASSHPSNRKARRVEFITLFKPNNTQQGGSKAEDPQLPAPMDHS